MADALDWSMSKVNRIESGEVTITSTDLQALLRLVDVTDPDAVADLTAAARAARRRGWWDQPEYRAHLTSAMIQSVQFETQATEIRSFQPTLIPGVLQTAAYASAVLNAWSDELSSADLQARLEVRLQRRDQLFGRPESLTYLLLLDESVLLREVGGPEVMSGQLYDLLEMSRTAGVIVRVVPLRTAAVFPIGMFMIYASDDEDVALYRENGFDDEFVYTPETIRLHRRFFEKIREKALPPDASTRSIEARAATLRSIAERRSDG